jgi:hypothetical protein
MFTLARFCGGASILPDAFTETLKSLLDSQTIPGFLD